MEAITPPGQLLDKLRSVLIDGDYSFISGAEGSIDQIMDETQAALEAGNGNEDQFINDVASDPVLIRQFIANGQHLLDASALIQAIHEVGSTYHTITKYRDEYDLYESYKRPSHTLSFVKVLESSPEVDSVISEVNMHNGKSYLVSMIGGEQYEIQVIPAGLGKCFSTEKIVEKKEIKTEKSKALFEEIDVDYVRRLAGLY